MNLRELKEKLSSQLEDSVVSSAEAVEKDSRPSRSLTIEKPSPGDEESKGSTSEGVLRHCRNCKHLRVGKMPTVPDTAKGMMTVRTVSRHGKTHDVPIEKVGGCQFAACALENWECGAGVTNPDQLKANEGYFREQANLCADYEPELATLDKRIKI